MVDDSLLLGRLVVWLLGGYLLGTSLIVTYEHFRVWRAGRGRLLPLHVWSVAVSYDLLIVIVLTRTGPLDAQAVIYIPALLLGCVAMTVLIQHQRLIRP